MKTKVALLIAFVVFVTVVLFLKIQKGFIEMDKTSYEDLPIKYELSKLDSELISKDIINKIKVIEVRSSKVRSPISIFSLDSTVVILYKLNNISSTSLKHCLKFGSRATDRTINETYNIIESACGGRFQYVSGKPISASIINVSFYGRNITTKVFSDSLVEFDGVFNTYSISYGNKELIDLFYSNNYKINPALNSRPSRLSFVIVDNSIYFLYLNSCKLKRDIQDDFITALFKRRT